MLDASDGEKVRLLAAIARYGTARREFLEELGLGRSNRDPLAEFSEQFALALLGGTLAASRVQKGYDLIDTVGRFVQVRYLANPADGWVNQHLVTFTDGLDAYALAIFENLEVVGLVVFPRLRMAEVGLALSKRHRDQDRTLQFTRVNWNAIRSRSTEFARLGVEVFVAPDWSVRGVD